MSVMSSTTTARDSYAPDLAALSVARPRPPSDVERAQDVQRTLRALARHCPQYARVLAGRSGVRLAGHVATGDVAQVTAKGREALIAAHALLTRACEIDPNLDTNTFMDNLVGGTHPRTWNADRAV